MKRGVLVGILGLGLSLTAILWFWGPLAAGQAVPETGSQAQPQVPFLASASDFAAASGLTARLSSQGANVVRVDPADFPNYRANPLVILIGGPHSPQVWAIMKEVLPQDLSAQLESPASGLPTRAIRVFQDVWVTGDELRAAQNVAVFGGANVQEVQGAISEALGEIQSKSLSTPLKPSVVEIKATPVYRVYLPFIGREVSFAGLTFTPQPASAPVRLQWSGDTHSQIALAAARNLTPPSQCPHSRGIHTVQWWAKVWDWWCLCEKEVTYHTEYIYDWNDPLDLLERWSGKPDEIDDKIPDFWAQKNARHLGHACLGVKGTGSSKACKSGDADKNAKKYFEKAVKAFKNRDDLLAYAWLGYGSHYLQDAGMPLHTQTWGLDLLWHTHIEGHIAGKLKDSDLAGLGVTLMDPTMVKPHVANLTDFSEDYFGALNAAWIAGNKGEVERIGRETAQETARYTAGYYNAGLPSDLLCQIGPTPTPTPSPPPTVFNLPRQFSGTQGSNNWYYYGHQQGTSLTEENLTPLTYDNQVAPWGNVGRNSWNGAAGTGGSRFLEVVGRDPSNWFNTGPYDQSGWLVPGEYAHNNIAIGWRAPQAATVYISAMLNTSSPVADAGYGAPWATPNDDGVEFSIYKGTTRLAGPELIFRGHNEGDRVGSVTFNLPTAVSSNEMVYFYVDRRNWQDSDGMYYSFSIAYDSTADRRAPISAHSLTGDQFSLSADDAGSVGGVGSGVASIEYAQYEPPGTGWTKYVSPLTLGPGTYKFMYRAVDNVGNVEGYHRVTITIP